MMGGLVNGLVNERVTIMAIPHHPVSISFPSFSVQINTLNFLTKVGGFFSNQIAKNTI